MQQYQQQYGTRPTQADLNAALNLNDTNHQLVELNDQLRQYRLEQQMQEQQRQLQEYTRGL